ncbi:MAG: NAD-dependent epimerase/dehydratase family protein [Planctomycetota bacterium]|nr:MAG: NAD-dependent epimerase/dehydratase family protein [Planctomycetota bacterium]
MGSMEQPRNKQGLVTGAGGVLGLGLAATLPADIAVALAGRRRPAAWPEASFHRLDLEQEGVAADAVQHLKPEFVMHAAAMTRAQDCEQEPDRTWRVNVEASVEMAQACRQGDIPFLFISTDMVFDGTAEAYAEDAAPNPLQLYGRSKAAAEAAVLEAGGTVARLPLLLGPQAGPGRMGTDTALLQALGAGQRPSLFQDEIRCPAAVDCIAEALWAWVRRPLPGVFHFAGAEAVSRFQLGVELCRAAAVKADFEAAWAKDYQGPPRPLRLVLKCERARKELGWVPPNLRESLARYHPSASEKGDARKHDD